jgi:hypothetical protein
VWNAHSACKSKQLHIFCLSKVYAFPEGHQAAMSAKTKPLCLESKVRAPQTLFDGHDNLGHSEALRFQRQGSVLWIHRQRHHYDALPFSGGVMSPPMPSRNIAATLPTRCVPNTLRWNLCA